MASLLAIYNMSNHYALSRVIRGRFKVGYARHWTSSIPTSLSSQQDEQRQQQQQQRMVKALYRQLIKWCQSAGDSKLPLTSFVPPIHMTSPGQIDGFRLELVAQKKAAANMVFLDPVVERVYNWIPPQSQVQTRHITIPIHSFDDLRQFFRFIFRMNQDAPSPEYQKERIDVTFESLRSLNEMRQSIEALKKQREKHLDRTNVQYKVGQVVQHMHDRWRGVIASWEQPPLDVTKKPSSLTLKDYTRESHVQYKVILDGGDAHSMGSSSGWSMAVQPDLVLIEDACLQRIRSNILVEHFTHFDAQSQCYAPNSTLQYEYPLDCIDLKPRSLLPEHVHICETVLSGLHILTERLKKCIENEASLPTSKGLTILSNLLDRLNGMLQRDIIPLGQQLALTPPSISTVTAHMVRSMVFLQQEIFTVNLERKAAQDNQSRIEFPLGSIVRHTKYGFRGVVVGWDPRPQVDVSRWDGLKDVEHPEQHPFYHVIPDPGDCLIAFGGPRPFRYVCQANLETCPLDERTIHVDLDDTWIRHPLTGIYQAPSDIRYKYGEDLGDDGLTERCMNHLQDELNHWQLFARADSTDDAVAHKVSFVNLMALLHIMDTFSEAAAVQELIKEMRKAHPRRDLRRRLETGATDLVSGRSSTALDIFSAIVKEDPTYAEAWNKRATCEYLMGRSLDAQSSTLRTLHLDPLHFQAMNGLGLIYFDKGEYAKAVEAFRQSIALDPWSPVGAKLSSSMDLVSHMVHPDELPH
jgi:hemimethylated DNA binding protein